MSPDDGGKEPEEEWFEGWDRGTNDADIDLQVREHIVLDNIPGTIMSTYQMWNQSSPSSRNGANTRYS